MNSGALKRTLVADLQYDPKFSDCKEKLFPIISRSTINCVPQWKFATRSNQHWENEENRKVSSRTKAGTAASSEVFGEWHCRTCQRIRHRAELQHD